MTRQVAAVAAQMNPNGGKTIRDAVDRIEAAVIELVGAVALIDARLIAAEEALTAPPHRRPGL